MIGKRYFKTAFLLINVNKKTKFTFLLTILLMIIESIFSSLSIASLYPIMEVVLNGNLNNSSNLFLSKIKNLNLSSDNLIKLVLIIVLVGSIFSIFRRYFQVVLGEGLRTILHENLSNKVMSKNLENFLFKSEGILVENLARNTDQCAMFLLKFLDLLFIFCYTFFLVCALLLVNYKLTAILFFCFLFSLPLIRKYLNLGTMIAQEKVRLEKKLTNTFIWIVNNLKEIYVLNIKNDFYKKVSKNSTYLKKTRIKNKMYSFLVIPFFEIIFVSIFLIIFIFFSDLSKIKESLPIFFTFFVLVYKILNQVLSFFSKSFRAETILAAVSSIKKDIGLNFSADFITQKKLNLKNNHLFKESIFFKNIKINYDKGNSNLKRFINLKFKKNSTTLLVGKSGIGKTSLLDLFFKIKKNYTGDIFFDKTSIKDINIEILKKKIGYVTQNCSLFNENLIENIILNSTFEKKKFTKLLELCDIQKLFLNRKDKINPKQLSGGEIRRICLARALYKQPEILLIDEALSSTDESFESKFFEKVQNLQITIILVSHRKSSVKNVDKIYSLDN